MRDLASRMNTTATEALPLWKLQLDFARIICSHEHFVALNLPSSNPSAAFGDFLNVSSAAVANRAASPTPSVRSTDSQSSFISHTLGLNTSTLGDKTHWAELTPDFRRRHYLVGTVLSLLSNALDQA